MATSSADGTAKVWDSASGQELFTLRGQAGVINVSYSRDGARLATAATDGSVKLWEASTGRELLTLDTPGAGATRASFSPDGSRLAVARINNVGGVYLLGIDDLVSLARTRLTRSFMLDECQRFLHLDTCPS